MTHIDIFYRRLTLASISASLLIGCGLLGNEGVAPAVRDASQKREVICDFVAVWASSQPELKRINELCKAGAQLKEIAAAYAECPAPQAKGK